MRTPTTTILSRTLETLPTLTPVVIAIGAAIVLTLSGCASSAGIVSHAEPLQTKSLQLSEVASDPLPVQWWTGFNDAELNALVDRALTGNPSLALAQARLSRAQAGADLAQADRLPRLDGSANVNRQRYSENGLYPPPLAGSILSSGDVGVSASWELDFFGRHSSALKAAIGAQRAADADAQAARVLLSSNVVRTYVQLARWVSLRGVAQRTLDQRDEVLGLIRQRVDAGLDTALDLRQSESSVPATRQQLEAIDEQISLSRHALAALTAQAPDAYNALTPRLPSAQTLALPANVPADLLARRADIQAARWRVEAATNDVARAKTDFYPNVNLTAFAGLSSIGLDKLFKASSEQYGAAAAIHLPIFDAGRLRANLRGRTADLDYAVESYNAAVIDAVHDVADQVTSVQSVARQNTQQVLAQESAEAAYSIAVQRYKAGLGSYLAVLSAEDNVITQRRLGADLKARVIDTQVALIRALGGGYSASPEQTALNTH
jgi:NodT family efflux transporter outer membrane factor (OMF) lipoprotein